MKSEPNGIVIVDKPAGMTSHDLVAIARRLFQTKRIGHTGTLDPDATGVLVLCLGQATRLAEYLSASSKHYRAEVTFGIESDTLDASGEILVRRDASRLTRESLLALLPRFEGTIHQIPPMVSARHHQGQRLYELARQGVTVEREAREVRIDLLELTGFQSGEHPIATLEITCSTGTYIRTLAADLGMAAETGAIMSSLRRTWVGKDVQNAFGLDEAHTLETLRERAETGALRDCLLAPTAALRGWNRLCLPEPLQKRLLQGQLLQISELSERDTDRLSSSAATALLDEHENLLAILRIHGQQVQPVKVFASHETV